MTPRSAPVQMHKPVKSKSPAQRMAELIRLQHEALLRVLQRVWYNDPGGSRTHDLRIKSPVHHSDSLGQTPLHIVAGASLLRPNTPRNGSTRRRFHVRSASLIREPRSPLDLLYGNPGLALAGRWTL